MMDDERRGRSCSSSMLRHPPMLDRRQSLQAVLRLAHKATSGARRPVIAASSSANFE